MECWTRSYLQRRARTHVCWHSVCGYASAFDTVTCGCSLTRICNVFALRLRNRRSFSNFARALPLSVPAVVAAGPAAAPGVGGAIVSGHVAEIARIVGFTVGARGKTRRQHSRVWDRAALRASLRHADDISKAVSKAAARRCNVNLLIQPDTSTCYVDVSTSAVEIRSPLSLLRCTLSAATKHYCR